MEMKEKDDTVIKARLLQIPSVEIDGKQVSFHLKKAEAAFYYLLVEKKVSRQELAAMLWPQEDSIQAHRHLRDSLYFIKKHLHPEAVVPVGRTMLMLNPKIRFVIDVDELKAGKDAGETGEFLQGFDPGGSAEYEEWIEQTRENLREIRLKKLKKTAHEAEEKGDFESTVQYLKMCISDDPLTEENYARLMRAYKKMHSYSNAAFTYQKLKTILAEELGISPLEETSALYREIMNEWNNSTDNQKNYGNDFLVARYETFRRISSDFEKTGRKTILLQGEAGVGKTHLLKYFLSHENLKDWAVFTSSCYQSKMEEILHPWQTIMLAVYSAIDRGELEIPQTVMQAMNGNMAFLAEGETNAGFGDASVTYNSGFICESILRVLIAAAKRHKILLVFEDIHWMDKISLWLLDQIIHRIEGKNLAVILVSRQPSGEAAGSLISVLEEDGLLKKYELLPFNYEESMQFIEQFGAGKLKENIKKQIYESARGNAFLLVQLLNGISEQKSPKLLPSTIKEICNYRIAGVSQEGRQVLNMIAMFPESAPYEILEKLSNKTPLELLYICLELRQRSLINEISDGGKMSLVFIQPEFRERVYMDIRPLNRRILHLNIASVLESYQYPGKNSELVYHYSQGGDYVNAFKYKVKGLQNQINLYYELLPSFGKDDELGLEKAEGALPRFDSLEKELAGIKKDLKAENRLLEAEEELLYAKCRYCIYKGFYKSGLSAAERLWKYEELSDEVSIGLHKQMIYYGIQVYNTDIMVEHVENGILEAEECGNLREKVVFKRLKGVIYLMQKKYELARKSLEKSYAELEEAFGNGVEFAVHASYVLNYIGETYREQGEYEEAGKYYEKAVWIARRFGAVPGLPVFFTNYGSAVFAEGKYEKAKQLFDEAIETAPYAREPAGRDVALAYQALYAYAAEHDEEKSMRLFKQAEIFADGWKSPVEQGTVFLLKVWVLKAHEKNSPKQNIFDESADVCMQKAGNLLYGKMGEPEKKLLNMCRNEAFPKLLFLHRNV